jgi:hypothetical protein
LTGWIGDFFRFWWALFYWNTRKTWFRLRGAHRDDCPCQNVSDSGLALQTRCDAIIHWHQPARFRRVCPLLKETPDGWRCSVEAEGVRPFWGRAALHAAGLLLAFYLAGTVVAYAGLRVARYEVSYLSVAWPPRWRELRNAQERLYATRAQQALARHDYQDAMLSLEMVCQLNPRNYSAGLALAGLSQVAAQPFVAEHIYERLMRDVPEQRLQTAQIWFRVLLARSAYDKIIPLAGAMLSEDPEQRAPWLNALLFAARQSQDSGALRYILLQNPHLPDWCTELITIELDLLENRPDSAWPALMHIRHDAPSNYIPYYQVEQLLRQGRTDDANTVLTAYAGQLAADDAVFLRLRIFHAKRWTSLIGTEFDTALQYPLSPRLAAKFCAYLVTYPAPDRTARFLDKFFKEGPAISAETLPLYQAAYLAAGRTDDAIRSGRLRAALAKFTAADTRVLDGLIELLQAGKPDPRLTRILPLASLPIEVVYAILEQPVGGKAP